MASFSSSDRNGVSGSECRGSRGVWEPRGETAAEDRGKGVSRGRRGDPGKERGSIGRSPAPPPDVWLPSPRPVRAAGAVP